MRNLPPAIIHVLRHFEPMLSERVWEWAKILLVGAILARGKRTVTSALRVMGLRQERQYQNFHRVTFSDTLAFVRQHLWPVDTFWMSPNDTDVVQIPRALFDRLTDTLAFAT